MQVFTAVSEDQFGASAANSFRFQNNGHNLTESDRPYSKSMCSVGCLYYLVCDRFGTLLWFWDEYSPQTSYEQSLKQM